MVHECESSALGEDCSISTSDADFNISPECDADIPAADA